jgi:prophage DNA circulation protein
MTITNISSGSRAFGTSLNGLSNTTDRLSSGLTNGPATSWRDKLRPASFRGVSFGVFESQIRFGRKTSTHEYPFRDTVWVEDLGRAARRISFAGFLVGDDCIEQRDALIKVCEEAAAAEGGELVHPSLGRVTVSLADQVTCVEHWDRGRMFEIAFAFVEQGQRQFPSSEQSTSDAVASAALDASSAANLNFLQAAAGTLKTNVAAALQVASTVQGWAGVAQHLVNDATSLVNYVQSLSGDFGRLFGQGTVRSSSRTTSIQSLIAQGALARTNVQAASSALSISAAALVAASGPGSSDAAASAALATFAKSTLALPTTLGSVAPTPSDGLRVVAGLLAAAPSTSVSQQTVPVAAPGAALTTAQAAAALSTAAASLLRRGSVVAQAQLAMQYQPTSRDDAQAVLSLVLASIDAEISVAGDAGEDETYNALRSLRTAVVQDLTVRATSLAALTTVSLGAALPAPVLAQRLYRDSTRADELLQAVDPVHPAFMPMSFQALAR